MPSLQTLDAAAASRVTVAFMAGLEDVDFSDYVRPFPGQRDVPAEAVRSLLDEAMRRFERADRAASDSWVGPRLHAVLRMTRREAASAGVWSYLSLVLAPDYVRWRFGKTDPELEGTESAAPQRERFLGREDKHALGRLWWMAELFRNGSDYRPAEAALKNQDVVNNFMRMGIAHHRPTTQAFVKVLGTKTGREANALAKAANVAATTILLEARGPADVLDEDAVADWISEATSYGPGDLDQLPEGPNDCKVEDHSVEELASLLEELLATAPVRGRVSPAEEPEA